MPQKEMTAPTTQTSKVIPTDPTSENIDDGTEYTPTPIVLPRMRLMAEKVVR
jgi:hypothetical protein